MARVQREKEEIRINNNIICLQKSSHHCSQSQSHRNYCFPQHNRHSQGDEIHAQQESKSKSKITKTCNQLITVQCISMQNRSTTKLQKTWTEKKRTETKPTTNIASFAVEEKCFWKCLSESQLKIIWLS